MIHEYNVKHYCCEDISLIENYEAAMADTEHTWACHHRAEILPCGRFSQNDLKKFGLYYNRPASELIFLTRGEHTTLHLKGIPFTTEHRQALSEARKGIPLTEEHCKALSEAKKGVPMSESHKKALAGAKTGVAKSKAHCQAISDAKRGKCKKGIAVKTKIDDPYIANPKCNYIIEITYANGDKDYVSQVSVIAKHFGVTRSAICSCLAGKTKSRGCTMRYVDASVLTTL